MPIESVSLVTYYNIFEYAYPVCLLTVAATLVYIGIGLWKANTAMLLPTRLTTFLFALFLFPTFLHAVNHITDTIENTTANNALNWFGIIGIPVVLFLCWFGMPGRMVFGRSRNDTRTVLKRVLDQHEVSYEDTGSMRLKSAIGTFVLFPLPFSPIVTVYLSPRGKNGSGREIFRDLEPLLEDIKSDSTGKAARRAAFGMMSYGIILGSLSFVSWATSTLLIRPVSIIRLLASFF